MGHSLSIGGFCPRIFFSQRQVQERLLRQVFGAREAASLLGFPAVSRREMGKCTSRSPEQPPRGAPHGWPDPRLRLLYDQIGFQQTYLILGIIVAVVTAICAFTLKKEAPVQAGEVNANAA